MVQKLAVKIGPSRFDMQLASVNSVPTEIDTPLFAGRVLVRIKDFSGLCPEGESPIQDSTYFEGRSRKFSILIEGRWKKREGIESYNGDEVQFGSDFDFLPASFPRGPFNLGFKIAHYIDEANTWVENPPNGRPYIMSPYIACMTTFCAYPAPEALSRALLLAHHDGNHLHHEGEEQEGGMVPLGDKFGKRQYWRFVGLKGDSRVDEFLERHSHLLSPPASRSASPAAGRPSSPSPLPSSPLAPNGFKSKPPPLLLRRLGTDSNLRESAEETEEKVRTPTGEEFEIGVQEEGETVAWGAVISKRDTIDLGDQSLTTPPATLPPSLVVPSLKPESVPITTTTTKKSRFSLATLRSALDKSLSHNSSSTPTGPEGFLQAGDLTTGDQISLLKTGAFESRLDKVLGPWRFGEIGVDILEDTTFIFLDPSSVRSVAARRKHFCVQQGKNRKNFIYDTDTIYAASFFSNFCDFNTFELKMGPVNLNISQYFQSQPVRYTLRSTRLVTPPSSSSSASSASDGGGGGGGEGEREEEVFATVSFQMVDC